MQRFAGVKLKSWFSFIIGRFALWLRGYAVPRFHVGSPPSAAGRIGLPCCALLLATCTNGNCDDEVCDIYLNVDVHPVGDAWKEGTYQLTWRSGDGPMRQCKLSVPVGVVDCDGILDVRPVKTATSEEFASTCRDSVKSQKGLSLEGPGETWSCAPPVITHFVLTLFIRDTPDAFALHLEGEDGTSIDRTFKPSYQAYYPNGKECGPTCQEGKVDFTF